jgi:signal transduction histidine kinase
MAPHPERKPSPPTLRLHPERRASAPSHNRRGDTHEHETSMAQFRKTDLFGETTAPLFPGGISYFPLEDPTKNLEDVGRGVAHKLRSGLCALKGGLQMSLQHMQPGPTRELLALAERGARHITEIVSDLVLLTQRPAFHPRPLDLNLLLSQFLNGLRRHPEWEGITVTRRLDGAIPLIWGDPDLLDTVFDAVAKNAVEAMAPRESTFMDEFVSPSVDRTPRPRRFKIETSRESANVVVRLTDTGTGLAADMVPLAFQPYFSTKSGHRGMGLPLARWLIHAHGGSLSLQSRPETGTTLTFRFPDTTPFDPDRPPSF